MHIEVKAYDIARSINLTTLKSAGLGVILCEEPLIYQEVDKYLAVFDFGVAVFFGYNKSEIANRIQQIKKHTVGYKTEYSKDDFVLHVGPKEGILPTKEELTIETLNLDTIKLVSIVLARSVSLEYYENLIDKSLEKLTEVIHSLASTGKTGETESRLSKEVGLALAIEHELAYNLEILDEPEILWEGGKKIEDLYHTLTKTFELESRVQILEKKLDIVSKSYRFLIDQLQARRASVLELIIILLILFEIIFFIAEFYLR
ncbi:MAG: RMD1 family protein [bacterium]|nr:RMD1 family protein [bacterium]